MLLFFPRKISPVEKCMGTIVDLYMRSCENPTKHKVFLSIHKVWEPNPWKTISFTRFSLVFEAWNCVFITKNNSKPRFCCQPPFFFSREISPVEKLMVASCENIWKHIGIYWNPLKTYENIWKSLKTYENHWKSMKTIGFLMFL